MHTAVHWHNFSLKTGGDQWRLQDLLSGGHDDRGAEGMIIEGPSWVGMGRGVVNSPSRVRGRASAAIALSKVVVTSHHRHIQSCAYATVQVLTGDFCNQFRDFSS